MASLKERVTAKIDVVREKRPWVDHVFTMLGHYGGVNGNAQAGAVTFFGFLSFFPILALAFFVIGIVAHVYPGVRSELATAIGQILPGVIGSGKGEIPLKTFEDNASAIGLVGLVGVLYSGLGWLSGMRAALEIMFNMPKREQPNFFVGKARDLAALALIGVTLIVSVALSGLVAGLSQQILEWVGLDPKSAVPNTFVWILGHGLAIVATTLLLMAMFRLLVRPHLPRRALFGGAVLGAVGFELLKSLANFLIGQTQGQPAFQAFGVALILVVWINYFSRLVMYAAAWAYTSPRAETAGAGSPLTKPSSSPMTAVAPELEPGQHRRRAGVEPDGSRKAHALAAAGVAAGLVAVGALALRRRRTQRTRLRRVAWARTDARSNCVTRVRPV